MTNLKGKKDQKKEASRRFKESIGNKVIDDVYELIA